LKRIKWNIRIDEKEYMIEFYYSSILKKKIKVYVDGNHIEGVKVILDEIGADYYFNINDNNILIYYRPIKTNANRYRIALDGFDYETDEKTKSIDLKARRKEDNLESKVMLFLVVPLNLLYFIIYNEIVGFDTLWITEHNLIRYQLVLYTSIYNILFLTISKKVAKKIIKKLN
jgi:hypothetical protein